MRVVAALLLLAALASLAAAAAVTDFYANSYTGDVRISFVNQLPRPFAHQ